MCELHRARMIEDAKSKGGISRLQRVWIWLERLNGKPFPLCTPPTHGRTTAVQLLASRTDTHTRTRNGCTVYCFRMIAAIIHHIIDIIGHTFVATFNQCKINQSYQVGLTHTMKAGCLRRYGIMSGLAAASHELVAYRGGDALSVCLNTVALIFIIECDDLLYENAVGEESAFLTS